MFNLVEVLSLMCSFIIFMWGVYTFMMALPDAFYEKVFAIFETKEEKAWEWAMEVDEEEEKLNQAHEEFKRLCRLFSDEEGFVNNSVVEAFDLTGVEYGVFMDEKDVNQPCCDKLICECAWKSKQ